MKKNIALILILVVLLVGAAGLTTYAVWPTEGSSSDSADIISDNQNSAEKYFVFKALVNSGSDEMALPLDEVENVNLIIGFAVSEYNGAVDNITIPSTFSYKTALNLPVKAILNTAFSLQSAKEIVTEVFIPSSVDRIDSAAFMNMRELRQVTIQGSGTINIGDYAFMNCSKLYAFNCSKTIIASPSAFANCPINPILG